MNNEKLWHTKLAARIHDPFEKALVLLRDRAGHEGGTTRILRDFLPLQEADSQAVKRADWWASAADRPQWPKDWTQVRWFNKPVLIHPLSGEAVDLGEYGKLSDTEIDDIKDRARKHFVDLADAVAQDSKKTLLAYWRFGSRLREEDDNSKLGVLWPLLPADTRVPDHSIDDHLDLTSAFAGAFAADSKGEAALLAISIGPVQPFIAAARSTSDLWAGSHLLARLAWEVMKPIAQQLGPDAILFPRLRGIPQVDLWLRDECGLPADWFKDCEWNQGGTDANPLFAAALPNRFVAVVPAGQARELAEACRDHVRQWLQKKGKEVMDRLLDEIGEEKNVDLYGYQQMKDQLAGFPEVHWAAVPFSFIRPRNEERQTDLDTLQLSEAMAPFFGVQAGQPAGFLDTEAWKVLSQEIEWEDGTSFFAPNPGVLYPAIYDLTERVMAAAKSVRTFDQLKQQGWRCALTGEGEWLTTNKKQLEKSYRQQNDTLWARIAGKHPAWAKKGEHLSALPAIKRLWPTLFSEEVGKALGRSGKQSRFVVSTHTMALAHQLDTWLEHGGLVSSDLPEPKDRGHVALPRKLVRRHHDHPARKDIQRLLNLLEEAAGLDDGQASESIRHSVRKSLRKGVRDSSSFRMETYYGLLLMDGDRMGQMLSGDDEHAISYLESFHPDIHKGFNTRANTNSRLKKYGKQKRAVSPNRHLAISGALNDFSQHIVPHIVEEEHFGKLIYAGGDDVLAMLPVADLLPSARRLRHAWSGVDPEHEGGWNSKGLALAKGFAFLNGRLYRCMGRNATASAGLVVAHHQAPLQRVLRELREAESLAKNAGRDRFHLRIIKRSGGALEITLPWGDPLSLLHRLRLFLADPAVSRRAVYNTLYWLRDLPEPQGEGQMLAELLSYQLRRQSENKATADHYDVPGLSRQLARLATAEPSSLEWLANFLSIAEFLAREAHFDSDTANQLPMKKTATGDHA